jgi:hypothetical protein
MSFTDDDLKRLKKDLRDYPQAGSGVWSNQSILGLVARLEAAEKYIRHRTFNSLSAWRKETGK